MAGVTQNDKTHMVQLVYRLKLFLPLLIFIIVAVFLVVALGRDPNAMPSALLDRSVPEFSLRVLGDEDRYVGQEIFLGEPSLLNVWATWCFSCRIEHSYLLKLSSQGVRIVGLNYKDNGKKAKNWLLEMKDPYALSIIDNIGRFAMNLGVFGAPETYLIDGMGIIRYKHVGVIDDRVWYDHLLPVWENIK